MSQPFYGEIRMTSWGFAAQGWALCNGQSLPISQNQALFSLLGTTYGGDGITTFNLPNLQARVPIHFDLQNYLGAVSGEESHTLLSNEMPMHSHSAIGSANVADQGIPQDAYWAGQTGQSPFAGTANTGLWAGTIANTGGSQPHDNMAPFLTISFMIALVGIYPSRT